MVAPGGALAFGGLTGPRVLRLITRLNIGGPARQALLLTRELAQRYPTVLATGTPGHAEGELADPQVAVTRVALQREISPLRDTRALLQTRGLLRAHRVRLLHTHMAKAGTVGRLAAVSVRPRPATVHTFHGHVLEGYFPPAVALAFVAAERALARATDVLVAVSCEVRDSLLALGVGRPGQYRVIPLGFDLSPHLAAERPSGQLRRAIGVGPDVPLVGVLGRLAPIKDHRTLLGAIARVPGAHLAVLGDGELRGELEGLARRLGIDDRTHFTGWWTDVPAALSDLDVVALSSRNEGTPVSLIEAHACARPAVATAVGGVASVVVDGVTGRLCPPGDPAALGTALASLLKDAELRRTMGLAGRAHVRDRFSRERLVADIVALYDELLA